MRDCWLKETHENASIVSYVGKYIIVGCNGMPYIGIVRESCLSSVCMYRNRGLNDNSNSLLASFQDTNTSTHKGQILCYILFTLLSNAKVSYWKASMLTSFLLRSIIRLMPVLFQVPSDKLCTIAFVFNTAHITSCWLFRICYNIIRFICNFY